MIYIVWDEFGGYLGKAGLRRTAPARNRPNLARSSGLAHPRLGPKIMSSTFWFWNQPFPSALFLLFVRQGQESFTSEGFPRHRSCDMSNAHLVETLTESFIALSDEVQSLIDRKTILEHKLRYAHEQVCRAFFLFLARLASDRIL